MKKIVTIAILNIILFTTQAQQTTPQLLKEPANWSFERFTLPPSFAPNFPYKGAEELRFSPGMFSKDSVDYFTYAFVAQLNNTTSVSQEKVKDYLLDYFKGLCSSTATQRKLVIDSSKINVSVQKKNTSDSQIIYNASLNVFGVFADGAPVKLNMEVKVLVDLTNKTAYLIAIASPQEKTNKVWTELYKIQKDFITPKYKVGNQNYSVIKN